MVFMVPDEPDETAPLPNGDKTGKGNGADEDQSHLKAQLDDAEVSKASRKVDLDLDDAPFLEDEEEEEELIPDDEEEEEVPVAVESEPKERPAWLNKKNMIIGGVGALVLLLLVIFLILPDSKPVPEPVEEPTEEIIEEVVEEEIVEPETEIEEAGESLVRLEPFVVEQRDTEENIRFLKMKIALSTPNELLADNLVRETLVVRYAVYYYLRSKDLEFLSDEDNTEGLKEELLSVINQYMSTGQFDTLLFEQYLIK